MDFDFDNQFHKDTTLQLHQNEHNDGYYQEYCRLFLANIALTNQVKDLIQQKNMLRFRLGKYQDDECFSSYERNQKAKRFRRNAHEIERFYKCTIKSCSKSYGSEGSLNQHYKLKHPQIYATLPNVQPIGTNINENMSENSLLNIQNNSNSKVSNILRQLGSYKSIKLEQIYCKQQISELTFDKQHKEYARNMKQNQRSQGNLTPFKGQNLKKQIVLKKQESVETTSTLKRSSRQIKKREINF